MELNDNVRRIDPCAVMPDLRAPLLEILEENVGALRMVFPLRLLHADASVTETVMQNHIGTLEAIIGILKDLIAGREPC